MLKNLPIMLVLCLMLSGAYYAKNYAGIIGLGLVTNCGYSSGIWQGLHSTLFYYLLKYETANSPSLLLGYFNADVLSKGEVIGNWVSIQIRQANIKQEVNHHIEPYLFEL